MKFELINDIIIDIDTKKEYKTSKEICKLLNEQEMKKLEYKRKLNTLRHRIQKVIENV